MSYKNVYGILRKFWGRHVINQGKNANLFRLFSFIALGRVCTGLRIRVPNKVSFQNFHVKKRNQQQTSLTWADRRQIQVRKSA